MSNAPLWDDTFVLRAGLAEPHKLVEATKEFDQRISVRASNGYTKRELLQSLPAFPNSKLRITTVRAIRYGMGTGWEVLSTPTNHDKLHASIVSPTVPITLIEATKLAAIFGDPEPNPHKLRNLFK